MRKPRDFGAFHKVYRKRAFLGHFFTTVSYKRSVFSEVRYCLLTPMFLPAIVAVT